MKHDEFLRLCARKVAQYETAREDINVHIDLCPILWTKKDRIYSRHR